MKYIYSTSQMLKLGLTLHTFSITGLGKLNIQTNIKTTNRKKLQLQVLVNLRCTYTEINKQLVKEERIKMENLQINFLMQMKPKMEKSQDLCYQKLR